MVESSLLIKALKEKIQREQEGKLLKIMEKQLLLMAEEGYFEIEGQDYSAAASSVIEKFGANYDFWRAALAQQLIAQETEQAQPLRGMFTQVGSNNT